ncbi:Rieske (2Fe-2S) protein, partial [Acinetobacter baumannii]
MDGSLLGARDMQDGFDRDQHGLKPVHCAVIGGFVWICLAQSAPDIDGLRQQLEPYLQPHRLSWAKVAYES